MKRRTISMLIVACMTVSMLAATGIPAMAAAGDLPDPMWVSPSDTNGIPVRIELNKASSGFPWGGGSSSTEYNLFLPGNAVVSECFISWDDGLAASDGENTYASGALPVPAPGEKKSFSFTNEAGKPVKFNVTVYQGSATVPPVFLEIDESQGTIAAMNNDRDHETSCAGTVIIDGTEYTMPKIKGRGNSSWILARTKKPYNVTLGEKVNLLGIDSAKTKKWSFLANWDEPSLLRDQLGYDMAHAMGVGQDSAQADVWMNGKYLGTYLITPKTDSFVPKEGFLIENDNYKEDPVEEGGDPSFDLEGLEYEDHPAYYDYNRITVKKMGDNLILNEEGKPDESPDIMNAAGERIRVYTQEVWDAIRSEDGYNSQGNYYTDYIDLRSWAAMYLLQDYIKNYDFCGGSIFFHRDGQTADDKLFAGPLWDLDLGFGCPQNNNKLGQDLDLLDGTGWFVRNVADKPKTSIFKVVGQHEDFMEEVSRVYNLYHSVFDDAPAHLEALAQDIQASAEMNQVVTKNESASTLRLSAQQVKQRDTEYEQVYVKTDSWRAYVDNVKTYVTVRSAFFHDNLYDGSEEGFPALFQTDANSSVTVYDTQDLSGAGTENPASAYARNGDTGEIDVSGEGQINFKVNLPNGYQIKSVTVEPAENYKNLKGPADTGTENAYRITKVTGPLTVSITAEEIVCEHEFVDGVCIHCGAAAMQVSFVCDEGVTINVSKSQAADSEVFENVTTAFPRSSATGEVDISGEGQVNFSVIVADGYKFESITAEPKANYKNFKGPDETLVNNGYRVTKITGDVTVTVKASKIQGGECEHEYQAAITPATCTAQGFTTYTCVKCGDSYVGDYTAKLPHNYQGGACTVCGEKLLNVTISCSEGASVTVLETQKVNGPKIENAEAANPRDGDTGLIDCSGEGQVNFIVMLAQGYELESVAAEPSGAYKNLKGPADTNIENGYRVTKVKGDFTITVTAKKTGDPACEHDYTAVVTEPSCTAAGYITYTCSKCGDSYLADKTPALGHDFKIEVIAPTCTDPGYTSYACTRCRYGYADSETEALGHDWDEGQITIAPTQTEPGERVRTCTRCGEKKTEVIPELSHVHEYKETVTAPTCTNPGYTTYTCRCGDTYTGNEVAALGHAYSPTVTAPTCTEAGFTTYTCSNCGDSYKADEVAALGHDFKNGVCTRCGEKEAVPPPQVDKTALNEAIEAAETVDKTKYTEASVKAFEAALKAAEDVRAREDATQDEVDKAVADLKAAINALVEKPDDGFLFDDVKDNTKFYFDPVYWAFKANPQITNGIDDTHFGPDNPCTRGHVVTFLWRAAGCPEPKSTETPFKDLKKGAFYEKAVAWAVEKGITNGLSDDKFGPDAQCNRGQIVTFLWRYKGQPAPANEATPFKDLKAGAFYLKAVAWAVENEVTNGISKDKFGPDNVCTRGQVVTFLYRATAEVQ